MAHIQFWVHRLAEQALKFVKYRFSKFGRLTSRDHREGGKVILKLFFLSKSSTSFNKNSKSTIQDRKLVKMAYIWFWVHCLAEHVPKPVKYRFSKFGRLNVRDHREGAKYILKFLFLSLRRVLRKHQRALSNTEN